MDKGPPPTAWGIVDFALAGALLGALCGLVVCCCNVMMSPTPDPRIFRDGAIGGLVGALFLPILYMIRLRIMGTQAWVRERLVRARKGRA